MSLNVTFIDGAEHYVTQDRKWKGGPNSSAPVSGVPGAHGLVNDDSVWGAKRHIIPATSRSSIRFRIRFRVNTVHVFLNINSPTGQHVQLQRNSDGTISVLRPGPASEATTTTYAIDTWYDVEFRVTVNNSGNYLLKVDGSIPAKSGGGVMSLSGVDTQLGGDSTITSWGLGSETLDTYTDNAVIDIAQSNLGTGQVQTLYPNGAGDMAQLTPSSLAPNWTLVEEAIADNLTSYVFSTVDNQRDCYTFEDLSISGSQYVVQVCATAAHDGSGDPTFHFRLFLRIDGSSFDGATIHNALTQFECFTEVWSKNPSTGNDWTVTEINALQAGVYCVQNGVRITQVVVEVAALTPTPDFSGVGFRHLCSS